LLNILGKSNVSKTLSFFALNYLYKQQSIFRKNETVQQSFRYMEKQPPINCGFLSGFVYRKPFTYLNEAFCVFRDSNTHSSRLDSFMTEGHEHPLEKRDRLAPRGLQKQTRAT